MLFARQHEFGRRERVGEVARLLGDAPGVDAGEGEAEHERHPVAELVEGRQHRPVLAGPGQRQVVAAEQGREPHRQQAENQRALRRQGRGRDHHRRQEEDRERVLQAACHEEQGRELGDVEAEQGGRGPVLQAVAQREADAQRDIEPGGDRDDAEAPAEGQGEAEAEMHAGDGEALACDGKPAQPDQRIEAQVTAGARQNRGG